MRPIRFLLAILCLALGLAIGALNAVPVSVDLGFVTLQAALGVVILMSLLGGVVLGGLALTASVILPLRRRLRREQILQGPQARPQAPVDDNTRGH